MEIKIYKTAEETCLHVAEMLAEMAQKGGTVALSGGSTPKLLFRIMTEKYHSTDWSKIRCFWVDERLVPTEDSESNYGEFCRILIPAVVPATSVFPVKYDIDASRSLSEAEKAIREQVPFAGAFPQFDLILLGIGEDGHTASIFPDNLQLFDTTDVVSLAVHPQTGQRRVTLTGNVINNAKRVVFLCTGKGKKEILYDVIRKKNKQLPAAHVDPVGELVYYLDEAAAEKL